MFENKGVYALLLGSGLSRSAQIPTGWEITLDLTRRVAALEGVTDQSDWAAWHLSRFGEPADYSRLLDALTGTAAERRAILHGYIEPSGTDLETGARQPTLAHHAIARLVRDGYVRVIITTNFDRLMENALREAGVEPTVIKSEDDLAGAIPLIHARCVVLKVHGDYLDTRLLNTNVELEIYTDAQNRLLDRIVDEHGLVVCGWSGDWDTALRGALARAPNRRYPTYWASRGLVSAAAQELIDHRGARLVPISDADTFFSTLQQQIETLESTASSHPQTIELLVGSAKRYLSKPEHRILLADLVAGETLRARKADEAAGLTVRGSWSDAAFRERVAKYGANYEGLCRVGLAMGRWGSGEDLGLARDTLQSLMRTHPRSGTTAWLKLMSYPAALFFTAYALGALKGDRLGVLREWLDTPIARDDREQPAFMVLFGQMWEAGNTGMWNLLDPSLKRYTPFNDHVLSLLQSWSSDVFFDLADVELSFEWLELLVGIEMTLHRTSKEELVHILERQRGQQNFVWSAIGRVSWHTDNQERLLGRMTRDPSASAILKANFAIGDREVLDLLDRNFRIVMDQRGR